MPQLTKKRRSGWAVLAVGALVASLFAVGAAPTGAAEIKDGDDNKASASRKAEFSACVGDASGDQGFTDLTGDDAFDDAINCLAYYKITAGTGDGTTYSPGDAVTRWQMDLFMRAAARVAAVDADDVVGTYATDGDASDEVTRADMAGLLLRLIDEASGDVTINDDSTVDIEGVAEADYFADARASVPRSVDNTISAIYELGVTAGTSPGVFSPNGSVTRGSMAVFITNALGHTNARPAGLTAQVGTGGVQASVRDASFAPVVNSAIDLFYISTANETKALKDDGTCSSRVRSVEGGPRCEVDGGDPATLSDGNALLAAPEAGDAGVTVWVWTGDIGDKIEADTGTYEFAIPPGEDRAPTAIITAPANAKIESDVGLKGTASAHFGDTVTFTVQLQIVVDDEDVDAVRGDDPLSYTLTVKTFAGETKDTAGALLSQTTSSLDVDADGSATFTVTATDPDPTRNNDNTPENARNYRTVEYELSDGDEATDDVDEDNTVVFTDERSIVTAVSVDAGAPRIAPGTGSTSGAAATVTLLDQYGDPVSGQLARLVSSAGDAPSSSRISGRSGQVRIGYSYSGPAVQDDLTAWWNATQAFAAAASSNDDLECPANGMVSTNYTDADDESQTEIAQCGSDTTFWVGTVLHANTGADAAENSGIPGLVDLPVNVTIVSIDTDNKQLVVDTDDGDPVAPNAISYDSNDFFSADDTPSSLEGFEEAVAKALDDVLADGTGGPTLSWTDYVFDDPSESAWFKLTSNLAG